MALSRKDFFRQSFFSLGETLLKAGGTLQEARQSLNLAPPREAPLSEAGPGEDRVARADSPENRPKDRRAANPTRFIR